MRSRAHGGGGAVQRALGLVVLALALGFALTGLCSVWVWQLRWPAADLWRQYVTLLGLPFPDNVLALENGHRPVLPNAVRALDAWCCGANQSAITAVALLLSAASFVLLLRATWRDDRLAFVQRSAIAFFAALATWWLINGRMLVQASEMLNVQFALLALLLGAGSLQRASRGGAVAWSAVASACGAAAAFAFGPGVAAFPALLLVAVAVRVPWRGLAVLAVAFPVVLWLYMFAMPGDEGVRGNVVIDPIVNLRHAMQSLGAPLFTAWLGLTDPVAEPTLANAIAYEWSGPTFLRSAKAIAQVVPAYGGWWSSSAITGAIAMFAATVVTLHALWRRRVETPLAAMGLALALFGCGVALVIALGRHDLFVEVPGQIFADRYLPWSCLCWLGLAIVAIRALPRRVASLSGIGAMAIALLAYPIHAAESGWAEAWALSIERGALALRLGIWDEPVMPWDNEASRAQVGETMRMLRAGNAAIARDLPDRAKLLPPGNTGAPTLGKLEVARRFTDSETGRAVLAIEGRTPWPQRSGELLVVDAEGRFRGLALLHGKRDWHSEKRQGNPDVFVAGYAFDEGCAPVYAAVVQGGSAQAIARLEPCTGQP